MATADTRERILNNAERMFAQRGYHGTSLREVADASGMRQSLVQYHYKSKDDLFRAVFERRALPLNHNRMTQLDAASGGTPDAVDMVRALVEPTVLLTRTGRGGSELYPQLVAQILNDPQDHAVNISTEFNDPIARATIRALRRALPAMAEEDLTWCYIFGVGAMISAVAGTGRVKRLSGGKCDPDDVERIVALLVPFIVGGIHAVGKLPKQKTKARQKVKETT